MGRALLSGPAELLGQGGSALSASSVDPFHQNSTHPGNPSCGEVSPGWNAASFRRTFPELWARYLRANYRTAYAVQKAFPGIDSKTARDWISGKRDPSGSFVAAVIARDPDAIKILGGLE